MVCFQKRVLAAFGFFTLLSLFFSHHASAQLTTFQFEAVFDRAPRSVFPVPTGTRAFGSFTFDASTPGTTSGGANTFTSYNDAITDLQVVLETFGIGTFDPSGSLNRILLGAPVRTTGSANFLSDQFQAQASATGLTVETPGTSVFGDRELVGVFLRLQDIDQQALSNEDLPLVPPSLSFFEDNVVPGELASDEATLLLNFQFVGGGFAAEPFRIVSITAVPEPGAAIILLTTGLLAGLRRRRA